MSKTVIEVTNLSKQYRLGQIGSSSIADDLKRFWHKVRGKEDPFLKIGDENDKTKLGTSEYVWALKDINFSVKQGDVLGIIGKNGAGKSTLLKILSRTTAPSKGEYKIKGRVASLLEVGTGFHPDLTGKENVFLNGAMLGMTKAEIRSKFDEIVEFSGVERYIETPVKRYSSGMYVRLAFAVAAHLEPEILIVDEVLAVGDAEFQKKCLGKMKDVSAHGRTVLFVSHNMSAVSTLCNKSILLVNGNIDYDGGVEKCIERYNESKSDLISTLGQYKGKENYDTETVKLLDYKLCDAEGNIIDSFNLYDEVFIEIKYQIKKVDFDFYPNLHFFDKEERYFFVDAIDKASVPKKSGYYVTRFRIFPYLFNTGIYSVGIAITGFPGTAVEFFINPALIFEVGEENFSLRSTPSTTEFPGISRIKLENFTKKIEE